MPIWWLRSLGSPPSTPHRRLEFVVENGANDNVADGSTEDDAAGDDPTGYGAGVSEELDRALWCMVQPGEGFGVELEGSHSPNSD